MKIAIISDIHGNLEALQRVLLDAESQKVDRVYSLGDVVGYGPFPSECLHLTRGTTAGIVRGNHEDSVLDLAMAERELNPRAYAGVVYSSKRLCEADQAYVRSLPDLITVDEFGLVLAHGSFTEPRSWNYITNDEEARRELKALPFRLCTIGHTHIPFVFGSDQGLYEDLPDDLELDCRMQYLINVGSVGQPRDGDCRASYGILEFSGGKTLFNLRRVFYDIGKTEAAFRQAGLPASLSERLFRGE